MADRGWSSGPALGRKRKQSDDEMDNVDESDPLQLSASSASAGSRNFPASSLPLPVAGIGRPLLTLQQTKRPRKHPVQGDDEQSDYQIHQRIIAAEQQLAVVPPSLADTLANLEKPDLLNILSQLLRSNPQLTPQISALLPLPTIQSTTSLLATLEKRLSDAFPYSKFGQDRSDYSFNRVRPVLTELKQSILHYLLHFTNPASYPEHIRHEFPATSMSYIHIATTLVHRLPRWDNPERNAEFRTSIYDRLGRALRETVAEISRLVADGKVFGAGTVSEWGKTIASHSEQVGGAHGFGEALYEFKANLGWLINLFPSDREVADYNYANGNGVSASMLYTNQQPRGPGGDSGVGSALGGMSGFACEF
ncbi:hypothetical protein M427DRAFT_64633 [Gonapodya prolifera JEL478]|uniref:Tethering factor for nuclear proteasome STS1 n=1 Tax=Gonapodya prolifera (strain JEL478) TaxID=1344416 RepID=A0A138ZXJ1_GONPJ|nr:hypothetical protein M427DRAFT_64633 [Gonapodya prolifera JEL478]|eukprot:KXS09171.1 hypothetical protein M427DRAFT_64633 [Gonapodya prolifera JEL478]